MNASPERSAYAQALELQAGIAHLKSICGEDDQELLSDMIEGELSLDRFVSKLVTLIVEDEASVSGLKAYSKRVVDRRKRLESRASRLRVLLASVVHGLPSRKFRNELASVRSFDIEPSVVIDEEADIPSKFWKAADPTLDVPAIRKYLNQRRKLLDGISQCRTSEERAERRAEIDREYPEVPGCHLDNGDISVAITVN